MGIKKMRDRRRGRKYSSDEDDSRSDLSSRRRRSRRDSNASDSEERSNRRKNSRSRNRSDSRSISDKGEKSQDECTELFVRNLPWKADENCVSDYFNKYGKVENVKILYDKMTGKAKGIGFVNFDSRSDAENVIKHGDDLEIDGRKIDVNFSNQRRERPNREFGRRDDRDRDRRDDRDRRREPNPESKTIFVGNLSFKTDEDSIRDFFDDCGSIEDVRIAYTQEGKVKGFCHVEFDSIGSAAKAMKKNGQEFNGRDLRIDFSSERKDRGGNRDRFGGRGGRDNRDGFRSRGGRDGSRGRRNYDRDRY